MGAGASAGPKGQAYSAAATGEGPRGDTPEAAAAAAAAAA
eukprot:SAG22_NODE_7633_length_721_cov_18.538585_1_plen_39_part_10